MTKAQEIKILKDAADRLDKNTYCGPWLREQISYIEDNLRSDYFPAVSYNDCVGNCARMKADAQAEIDQRLEWARNEAARIEATAQEKARRIIDAAKARLLHAINGLGS